MSHQDPGDLELLLQLKQEDLEDACEERDDLQRRLEEAVEEIIALKEQLSGCDAERRVAIEALRDAVTERVFWKSATERALRLWERAQDEKDELRALARRAAWKAYCYADIVISDLGPDEEVEDDCAQAALWLRQLEEEEASPL